MESISIIKEKLNSVPAKDLLEAIKEFETDERKGVIKLIESAKKRYSDYLKEQNRLWQINSFEREGYAFGARLIGGIDEVGRGPLAGPVVTAVVILKEGAMISDVNDSKKLSAKKREELYDIIIKEAIDYSVGVVSSYEIDNINILQATYKAMQIAINGLKQKPDYLLVDAVTIPKINIRQKAIIKGDEKSISIGAASIIAKVTRDRIMEEYDKIFPEYDFDSNKGYGSQKHIDAIKEIGICSIHRKTFVKNFINGTARQGKEQNKEQGNFGELLAAKMLIKNGYKIVERNYTTKVGEIDIIAEKDEYIAFIEVKFRSDISKGRPAEAVDYYKQKKIIKVAKEYILREKLDGKNFRFDVVEVLNGNPPMGKIIKNAFGE